MDGSIEFLGDWFDPTADQSDQSDQLELLHEQSAQSDAQLVGRKTFEDFRSYWPAQTAVKKCVVSTTIDDPKWENTTVLDGDPVDESPP